MSKDPYTVYISKEVDHRSQQLLPERNKNSFTLSNSIVSIRKKSLTCILSELISFEHKSLQYLHAFCVDLITLK